jgi:virginiamycin B lyase
MVAATALVACSGGSGTDGPQGSASSSGAAPSESATPSASSSASSVEVADPVLPEVQPVGQVGGVTIKATTDADWTIVAFGRAWVSGLGKGMGIFDARSGRALGSVSVPQVPCAGADAGFGALWTATCVTDGIVRIDPQRARVTGKVALSVPDSESSIGVGEGAVWAVTDGSDCAACVVARIDPRTVRITDRFPVPTGATAVRAGLGGVWITYFDDDSVLRLDPQTGQTVATIPVADGPRFFDVGAGSVWVMAQTAGALCQIDPRSNHVVGCTLLDPTGVRGGDLTVGDGFVWWRGTQALVAQVDPGSGEVVRRIGPGQGSGDASAGSGHLWISAHDVANLYRVPVR